MKKLYTPLILLLILCMTVNVNSQSIIPLNFDTNVWKPANDTNFTPNLWFRYANVGLVDPAKCALPQSVGSAQMVLTTDYVKSGPTAGKCVLDVTNGIAHRAMFRNDFLQAGTNTTITKDEKWFKFSMYLADTGAAAWVYDTLPEAVFQLHNDIVASPELALECLKDTFTITYRYSDLDPHVVSSSGLKNREGWKGILKKGRWLDWVWHVKLSPLTGDGFLEVWMNEGAGYKKIINLHGIRFGFPCPLVTNFDVGVYKWDWKCPQTDPIKKRTIYFDEAAVGDSAVTFEDIAGVPDSSSYLSAGNLVVLRVGDGVNSLTANTNPVFLDEFTPVGNAVNAIPLPVSVSGGNKALTLTNTRMEGLLTRSPDGTLLAVAGYNTGVGTTSPASTSGSVLDRTIGLIDFSGTVNTRLSLNDYNNSPRSVVTDGTGAWLYGGAGGVRYAALPAPDTTLLSAVSSTQVMSTPDGRAINIYDSNLYASPSGSTFSRVFQVGTGLPTTSGQTAHSLTGVPLGSTESPIQFFLADLDAGVAGVDVLYYADENAGGGIRKYSLVSGTWVLNGTVSVTGNGALGLTAVKDSNRVTIYVTSPSRIFKYTDTTGYNGSISGGPLLPFVTAGSNKQFRGIAFAPVQYPLAPSAVKRPVQSAVQQQEAAAVQAITVYPNPASQLLTVKHPKAAAGTTLRLTTLNGKTLQSVRVAEGATQTVVHVTALKAGEYFITIEHNTQKNTTTFIKL